ncbi:MAG: DUF6783 domain-containing protein [Anaerobutyricum hallii]
MQIAGMIFQTRSRVVK